MSAKFIKWVSVLILVPLVCLADSIRIKDTAPEVYVVEKGDTLWDISSMYLDKPWLWPELWRNNTHINNPHLIYPGDEIRLRINDQGEPVLEMVRNEPDVPEPEPAPEPQPDPEPEVVEPVRVKQQLKLTPEGYRTVKSGGPIPVLPWSLIEPYVERDMVMSAEEYERLPRVLGDQDGGVRFATDDLVLSKSERRPSEKYQVIRKQNEIYDEFDNLLGIQVRHVADAKPLDADLGNEALMRIEQANFEVKRGDKLMPAREVELPELELKGATRERGRIVDSLEQHGLLGKFDVVVLDLGQRQIDPGTVMGIYNQGPIIIDGENPLYESENNFLKSAFSGGDDVEQPAIKVGELVVFQVFEKASYALIIESTKVIREGAIVANP